MAASGQTASSTLGHTLEQLKRRGSNLLVVGPPSTGIRQAASRRLLGDATTEPRRRLFVFTDGTYTHARLGNGPIAADTARVVTQPTATRGTASTRSTSADTVPHEYVENEKLSALAWSVADEIKEFSRISGGLSPGELRVCVDSLAPIVEHYDDREVTRFLSTLTNRVRSTGGMAHYHLPADIDDATVEELRPMFDAVVELRLRGGTPEQRWHVDDRDVESGWLPM